VPHSMCGSGARWCARADAIFDVPDMHVLDVEIDDRQRLVLTIESGQLEAACPACGVLAAGHAVGSGGCMMRPASGGSRCCDGWCGCGGAESRVPDDDVQRGPRCGAASDGVDDAGGGVGDQRAQSRRHHRLGAGEASGCGLAHRLGCDRGGGQGPHQRPGSTEGGKDARGR
jgi:hypothetical protein